MEDPSLTDEQIALLIQKGQIEKFGVLMKRYDQKLVRYGSRFLAGKENIEDIVQDIFLKTYQNIQSFNSSLRFSSWIYRIAHNSFVNELKKQKNNPISYIDLDILVSHPVYEGPTIEEKELENYKKMIEIGLNQLRPKYKEILILHFLEELSYKEISDILRVPIGTVGIRLKRAKESLKLTYQKMNYEPQLKYET